MPGGCWFFTVNLLDRRRSLLVDHIATLRDAVAATRQSHAFGIDAFVVLPDHLHAIWKLPPGDCDFSTRWRLIKNRFARALPKQERLSAVRVAEERHFGMDLHGRLGFHTRVGPPEAGSSHLGPAPGLVRGLLLARGRVRQWIVLVRRHRLQLRGEGQHVIQVR